LDLNPGRPARSLVSLLAFTVQINKTQLRTSTEKFLCEN